MSDVVQAVPHTSRYLADFDAAAAQQATQPAWLREARRKAMDHFASAGFPTTRDEEWKFTSVAPIAERTFEIARSEGGSTAAADIDRWMAGVAGPRLVVLNGVWAPSLSGGELPPGVRLASLRSVLETHPAAVEPYLARLASPDRQAFTALNTAFLNDGAFIWIPPGTVVEQPITVLFVTAAAASPRAESRGRTIVHPRLLIIAGDNSQARIVERYVGTSGAEYFSNAVTEVSVGAGAVIDHYKVQHESRAAFHIASMHLHAARDSNFSSHSFAFGGALVRNDVVAVLDGEGGECTLNGLYLADERRLVDNHTTIDHAKPHCASHEVYKGILAGHARAVFNGKIIVRPDAQKTDAKQTNRALLLSDDAQINTKPQLEIFANDVKCTHGAAVGQLDEDAMFYLRARGIGVNQARNILIHAFAGDVINRVRIEPLKRVLEDELFAELRATGGTK
jgi:Fe-S cluster assembly protein SufD